ncbi:hypothetical protein C8034_v011655 [Colletotrichum sidae]|uniref:Uncharacterized protein n=2 Tax=Colletotrichum orbiculare species complex TaxID=2707354 RepID=A0A4R8Q1X4_9PEZI|nr:hypothetical protein C8035_v012539 [Colletotrichum spinosum]TEA09877.1 hypothetical protein C8034_v011655 [Colletotrichum sidae]
MDHTSVPFNGSDLKTVYSNMTLPFEGLYRWGFYLYRTTYDDQPLWERYISGLRQRAMDVIAADASDKVAEMQQCFRITVIEDKDTLDGKSIEEVQQRFNNWVHGLSDDADEEHEIPPSIKRDHVRFYYCLFVDAACLASMDDTQEEGVAPFVKVITTEMLNVPVDEDDEWEPEGEEGTVEYDWMYVRCDNICNYYDMMMNGFQWDRQYRLCRWPEKHAWSR